MKMSSLVTANIVLVAGADAFAHYANALKRSGKLSSEDVAKLDAIERDPGSAEDIILEQQCRNEQYPRRDPTAALSSSDSLLGLLPLGGGLRMRQFGTRRDPVLTSRQWTAFSSL